MSTTQKDWLSKWLPLIFAVGANVVTIAYGYGQLNQRIVPLEKHCNESLTTFVTRAEFSTRIQQRDREMQSHNEWLARIEAKLDKVLASGVAR